MCVTELQVYPISEMFWKDFCVCVCVCVCVRERERERERKIKCYIFQMKIQPHSVPVSESEM